MHDHFELRDRDLAGRIGRLSVLRAGVTAEMPALLPVANPNIDTISPAWLEFEFDVEIFITNSYIAKVNDHLRKEVLDVGLHEMLDLDGAIMTDLGSFQFAEYGEIDMTTEEILQFQRDISTDVATPIGIPTPPDVAREQAEVDPEITRQVLADAEAVDTGEMPVNTPVQESTYSDFREGAGRHADAIDLDVFPVGVVAPMMNAYRYDDMVDAVVAAKHGPGVGAPVHLFGTDHPIVPVLAVTLGCDLFDSAAYALYARDGRYLTVHGTEHLEDLSYLPCTCPIYTEYSPDDLHEEGSKQQEQLLAEHNLHVTFAELRHIKQAIRDGDLMELAEERARLYLAMPDGYRALLAYVDQLEREDPASKGALFYASNESAYRLEVARHHARMDRLTAEGHVLLTEGGVPSDDDSDTTWRVVPPFGPFLRSLSETYLLTAEVPERLNRNAYEQAARGVSRLVEESPDAAFTLAYDDWPESALARVFESVKLESLSAVSERLGDEASVGGGDRDNGGSASSVE